MYKAMPSAILTCYELVQSNHEPKVIWLHVSGMVEIANLSRIMNETIRTMGRSYLLITLGSGRVSKIHA